MSKRNTSFPKLAPRPLINTREKQPIPMPTKNGILLLCPFCDDRHALIPNQESPCGTRIEVKAVQEVISAKLARKEGLICVKCHKVGGEFVRYRNVYVHLANCSPGTVLLQEEPKNNVLAQIVFKMPKWAKERVEPFAGRADRVLEIDEAGKETGKVLSYLFRKRVPIGKQEPART